MVGKVPQLATYISKLEKGGIILYMGMHGLDYRDYIFTALQLSSMIAI